MCDWPDHKSQCRCDSYTPETETDIAPPTPFVAAQNQDLRVSLCNSHARENHLVRSNFDLKNQNRRLRAAIADAVSTLGEPLIDPPFSRGALQARLSKVLQHEDNL